MIKTKKTPADKPKTTRTTKPKTVKMYNSEQDRFADVHPDEVENYRKGGYQEV